MTIREISISEFEHIVDKLENTEMSIDVHTLSKSNTHFPEVNIGTKTHCESNQRKIIIQRYINMSGRPIDNHIVIKYDPIISIYRDCLFVKPDDVIQKRLDSILDEKNGIKFYLLDTSHPKSMISMFKDVELREDITPYKQHVVEYDVVIVFYTDDIRNHLSHIQETCQKPYSGIKDSTLDKQKQKIVDKYISSFNYKHIMLIIILTSVIIFISLVFGIDTTYHIKSQDPTPIKSNEINKN
jgi:hypothetical protein